MKLLDESELRSILRAYRVCDPPEDLIRRTKLRMREEMAIQAAAAPARQQKWAMALIGLAFVLSLNLFYILTVGTVIGLLSPQFAGILKNLTIAFSMAEGCILAWVILVFYFKQVQNSLVRTPVRCTIH
jgi:hypothetical protein